MATPFVTTPLLGADIKSPVLAADIADGVTSVGARLGQIAWGSDGRLYVFAQSNASIPASTAVCTVNATSFLAGASGGAYTSPATALVAGDRAWFHKAAV